MGSSGAWAKLGADGQWEARVVSWDPVDGHRLMNVEKNLADLDTLIAKAGGPDKLIVAYEKSRKNRRYGVVNNFTNGRNEEFWRVLLAMRKIRAIPVDPKTWQAYCFKGIPGREPKPRAREFIRRHCPGTEWLEDINKAPRLGIVDAMCIALWAKHYCEAGGLKAAALSAAAPAA